MRGEISLLISSGIVKGAEIRKSYKGEVSSAWEGYLKALEASQEGLLWDAPHFIEGNFQPEGNTSDYLHQWGYFSFFKSNLDEEQARICTQVCWRSKQHHSQNKHGLRSVEGSHSMTSVNARKANETKVGDRAMVSTGVLGACP